MGLLKVNAGLLGRCLQRNGAQKMGRKGRRMRMEAGWL